MKIKIKQQLTERERKYGGRIFRRFKWSVGVFCLVLGSQYLMSKSGETIMDSYFANASGKEFVELDNELIYSPNGDILDQKRHLAPGDPVTSTTPKSTATTTTTTTNTKPKASTAATTTAGQGKMKGKLTKASTKCAKGAANCFEDKNGNSYTTVCKPGKDHSKLGSTPQCFDGTFYEKRINSFSSQGYIEEYYNGELCDSMILIPGTSLLHKDLLGFAYFMFMLYLFLGISVIADIFMEAIEVITSSVKDVTVQDKEGKLYTYQVPVWNPTIANLTLMALGSSAPEILLSVIEALKVLGEPSGELGPSSIVGSGAFNLLCISGISILAVEEPKKIYDLGVYSCTAFFSIFAYSWMYFCLEISSPNYVTPFEAFMTLFFFFLLVIMAFGFDKLQQGKDKVNLSKEEQEKKNLAEELKIKRSGLRVQAKVYGKATIINIARGKFDNKTEGLTDAETKEIISTYKEVLGVDDLASVNADQLLEVLEPEALLERFAAKKANKVGKNNDFLAIKGNIKGQFENEEPKTKVENLNDFIGFKCLHYSVTESAGVAVVTVVKRAANQSITFGVRTVKDTAIPGDDYKDIDFRITMAMTDVEKQIEIPIVDNQEWEPDLDFLVELYEIDAPGKERLQGDDTQTRVTILDEDFPGTLGFQVTDIRVNKSQERVDITIKRSEGSDGKISCIVKTEALTEKGGMENNAVEFEDYLPCCEKVIFENGEMDKTIPVLLVNEKINMEGTKKTADDDEGNQSDGLDIMFKVKIEKAEPQGVKISKRNTCIITILQNEDEGKEAIQEEKLLNYFIASKEPTWGDQFKNAVMLGPQIDEEDMIVVQVGLGEALFHFALIGWKLLFACVPPVNWGGGAPAFGVALSFIGFITAIVGTVAGLLGCVIGLDPSITAITIVAIGTSLPDTFASVTAAQTSEYADSAIGNVTGSNSVNVFLGLGLPWVISSMYMNGLTPLKSVYCPGNTATSQPNACPQEQEVPAGKLGFSVFMFLVTSLICFSVLTLRRIFIGGELGGPVTSRWATAIICWCLWIFYTVMSILNAIGALGRSSTK